MDNDRQVKLMEMVKELTDLPNTVIWREKELISVYSWGADNLKGSNIHWLELCILHLAPKLDLEPIWTDSIFTDMFKESTHPIDYLYTEYSNKYK